VETDSINRSSDGNCRPFRIAVYPSGVSHWANAYFRLLHAALRRRGVVVSDNLELSRRWLKAHAADVDAVHLNWPERIWQRGAFGRLNRLVRVGVACWRLLEVRRTLRAARRRGIRCIWTVHNLEPHEGSYRWDRVGYRMIAREADLVICHSRCALEAVRQRYPPRGTSVVMPIGDQSGDYPAPRPRARVVSELGLDPDIPIVCCLGRLRHYKGVELACEAVVRLEGRAQLVIGGVRHAGYDLRPIRERAYRTRGIVLLQRRLSTQEYADLLGASEAMLLPYRQITGSAALLSALGFGRGVIVSDLPYFKETLAPEPDAGLVVPTRDPGIWAESILEYLGRPADTRSAAARRLAGCYSWDRCVEPLIAALLALDERAVHFAADAVHA
jgi:beta-1,4-mannosyltransferase